MESLLQGHVSKGHLQICLDHKEQFKRLYQQCMKRNMISSFALSRKENVFINDRCIMFSTDQRNNKSETVRVDAEAVLAQREKDLNAFVVQNQQMDILIKMIAKVTESISGTFN